jgi:hypothetical protein
VRFAILALLSCALFPSTRGSLVPVFETHQTDSSIKFNVNASIAIAGTLDKWDASITFRSPELMSTVLIPQLRAVQAFQTAILTNADIVRLAAATSISDLQAQGFTLTQPQLTATINQLQTSGFPQNLQNILSELRVGAAHIGNAADATAGIVIDPPLAWRQLLTVSTASIMASNVGIGDWIDSEIQIVSAPQWTQLTPTGGGPAPRAIHTAVYVPGTNQMIVFAGETFNSGNFNDVWRLTNANGVGAATWTQITPAGGPPAPRLGASAVHDPVTDSMIIFGGGLGHTSPCANDAWVLANASGIKGSPAWSRLSPTGPVPAPRWGHTSVYDPATNSLIVYGGNDCFRTTFNDVWVLRNANGLGGAPFWTQLPLSGTGPAGVLSPGGEGAAYAATSNRMILFLQPDSVFVLSNANGLGGVATWTQLTPSGAPPSIVGFAELGYDGAKNRLIVYGAPSDGTSPNDVWVLSNADGSGGTPSWTRLGASNPRPRRDSNSAVYDSAGNRLIVFGGGTSTGVLSDVWVLGDPNGADGLPFGSGDQITDTNHDGVPDDVDPLVPNPDPQDSNLEGIGDACETPSLVRGTAAFLQANLDGTTSATPTPFTVAQEPPLADQIARIVKFRVSNGMTHSPAQLIATLTDCLVEAGSIPPQQASQLVADVMQKVEGVVDVTPPMTIATLSPQSDSAGWNNSDVTVTLTSVDNVGGSGVKQITYRVNGVQNIANTVAAGGSVSFTVNAKRLTTVTFFGTDNAENVEAPKTVTVKIDETPPVVTASANPAVLWPPNGKTVDVMVSGRITDVTSGVNPNSATFSVVDAYGTVQPSGDVVVSGNGSYSFTVALEARRSGTDQNGRVYTIVVSAQDNAGNQGSASTTVVVPHDRRN